MGLAGVAALGIGAVMVTLAITLSIDWDLNALCPAAGGTATFCGAVWWSTIVEYLPVLLFLGQIVVVIVMGSPVAFVRSR